MNIAGLTAVITGGASGLGAATTRRLHRSGAIVVIADFNERTGLDLVLELGERAAFVRCDVQVTADLQAVMDKAVSEFGPLRLLVNCAGIGPAARIVTKSGSHDIDVFKKVIAVNLVGTFDAIRLAAQSMVENEPNEVGERGVIVNTSSVSAFEGQIGQAAYANSKAGVAGLTIVAARDLANYGIRVCSIAPGTFDTPMLAAMPPDVKESLGRQTPFPPRLGKPEEYAMLVQHIVENSMLNGETIRLDGALRMAPR